MSRDFRRRLRMLEIGIAVVRENKPLAPDQFAMLTSMRAASVAMLLGDFEAGTDPLHALYRGVEKAFEAADKVSPLRYCFVDRMHDACSIALNGTDSVAVPIDWADRMAAIVDRPEIGELMDAFGVLHDIHSEFADRSRKTGVSTMIDASGVEWYRWPEKVGCDRPPQGWRGQGFDGAATYWASR